MNAASLVTLPPIVPAPLLVNVPRVFVTSPVMPPALLNTAVTPLFVTAPVIAPELSNVAALVSVPLLVIVPFW
ncbi:hypothetical protein AGMMS49959_07250 [Planctomycetales bacterium]|nr:hypothetical protein AGMMS49959_07250 [Planctomycetales bacterium]